MLIGSDNNGQNRYIPLDDNLLGRHIMLLGGIGTGKTTTFNQIISQLRPKLTADDVMIIFDTKGDFYKKFYQPGDVVISNDNTATGTAGEDYWNIFNEIERDEHMEENIIEIANTLFYEKTKNTSQPFFPNAAKDLFSAVLTHFCRSGNPDISNQTIRDFFSGSDKSQTSTVEALKSMLEKYDDLCSMISYINDPRSPQTQGVMSELTQVIRQTFLGNFKKTGTLAMRNLVRSKGGKLVFIEYDLGVGRTLSPIYSLLFDLAIKEALCRKHSEGNVFFITDEFSLLPNLQHIDDAVNFGRSLGVKFMIGIQNIQQVFENYGENRARSLLSGFLTSICFRVNEETTKEFIKGMYGQNRKIEVFTSAVAGRGITENVREGYVVEDSDILNLKVGQAIIGFPGLEPFVFKFNE